MTTTRRRRRTATTAVLGLLGGCLAAATFSVSNVAAATLDTCGYPLGAVGTRTATIFNESTVTRAVQVFGTGTNATIGAFANDESGLLLGYNGAKAFAPYSQTTLVGALKNGINYTSVTVDPLPLGVTYSLNDTVAIKNANNNTLNVKMAVAAGPGSTTLSVVNIKANANYAAGSTVNDTTHSIAFSHAVSPALGDTSAASNDAFGRPLAPSIYITDITSNASLTVGDWQSNGTAEGAGSTPHVDDVFGTWDTAATVGGKYTVTKPGTNNWNIGAASQTPNLGADTPDADAIPTAPLGFASLGKDEGYGTEVRWNVSSLRDQTGQLLQGGHTYRVQVITHDGDQNQTGGDAGEVCANLRIPGPPLIQTDTKGGGAISGQITTNNAISEPVGASITDTAQFSGDGPGAPTPTGTVTFRLYFWPGPKPSPIDPLAECPGTLVFTDPDRALDSNGVATSGQYTTSSSVLGTYFWQDTYTPAATEQNYTTMRENCGVETVSVFDARVRVTPHEAYNQVGSEHTVTATVESVGPSGSDANGAALANGWTGVGNAVVVFTLGPSGTAAGFTSPAPNDRCTTSTTLGSVGHCTVTFNDSVPQDVIVHADSVFGVSGVEGGSTAFHRSTNTSANCGADTCDAIKHYFKATTSLTANDLLVAALPSNAGGSITYKYFASQGDCTNLNNPITINTVTVTNGTFTGSSPGVTVDDGFAAWFTATYSGDSANNVGGFTTACTEVISSGL
jgi:hypothetical protein